MVVGLKVSGVVATVVNRLMNPPLFRQGERMRKCFADPDKVWSVGEVMRHGPMRYVPEFVAGEQAYPSAAQRAQFKQEQNG